MSYGRLTLKSRTVVLCSQKLARQSSSVTLSVVDGLQFVYSPKESIHMVSSIDNDRKSGPVSVHTFKVK